MAILLPFMFTMIPITFSLSDCNKQKQNVLNESLFSYKIYTSQRIKLLKKRTTIY